MSSPDLPPEEFLLIGTYSIVDARRLLAGLEAAKVKFDVEFRDAAADIGPALSYFGGAFGQRAEATVRVAPEHKAVAERVHAQLFGDCLPNYDASFFTGPGASADNDT